MGQLTLVMSEGMFMDYMRDDFSYDALKYLYEIYTEEDNEFDREVIRGEWNEFKSKKNMYSIYPDVSRYLIDDEAEELDNGNFLMREM